MRDIFPVMSDRIELGHQGENRARRINFDFSGWQELYGSGSVQLIIRREGDDQPYPAALTVTGTVAGWVVTAADTARPGRGQAELQYYVGSTLVKSKIYKTDVIAAMAAAGDTPPEPQQDWVAQVVAVGAAAAESAAKAEQAAVNAGYMFFCIDENGDLIYERTSNTQVDFCLLDGNLYVEVIA